MRESGEFQCAIEFALCNDRLTLSREGRSEGLGVDHQGQGVPGGDEDSASDEEVDAWALLRASKRAIEAVRREFERLHAHARAIGDENGASADRERDGQSDGE